MATIHLESSHKWYNGKKTPRLQIMILIEIAKSGELSGSKFKRGRKQNGFDVYNAQIYAALRRLEEHGLIEFSKWILGKGRKEKCYKLTFKGLLAAISHKLEPEFFWSGFTWYYLHKKRVQKSIVEDLLSWFEKEYFGYLSVDGLYLLQLDLFHSLLTRYIENNKIFTSDSISPSQIVLEVLALNKQISIADLIIESHLSKSAIVEVLDEYSMKKHYFGGYYLDDADYFEYEKRAEEYLDFLTHCLITQTNENNETRYELSLFGIIILLAIIRYSQMDDTELSKHFEKNLQPNKLFNALPIEEYLEKIVRIHKNKLPLVFTNWQSIKTNWGKLSVYLFDPIIDKKASLASAQSPLFDGGIRALYNDVEGTVLLRRSKLKSFVESGLSVLAVFEYHNIEEKSRVEYLRQILSNTMEILRFSSMYYLLDSLEEEREKYSYKMGSKTSGDSHRLYDRKIDFITASFRDEVQMLFYLNLCKTKNEILLYPISEQMTFPEEMSKLDSSKPTENPVFGGRSPVQGLQEMLATNSIVRKKFASWINEIFYYHQDDLRYIEKLSSISNKTVQ